MIKKFEVGKWYRWNGDKNSVRPKMWNMDGFMDYVLDGLSRQCLYTDDVDGACLRNSSDSSSSNECWFWGDLDKFDEVSAPDSKTVTDTKLKTSSALCGLTEAQQKISAVSDAIKSLLLYKNEKYGNSALEPMGVFFKNRPEEADYASILIRMDDKLSRLNNRDTLRVNDISDFIGYLNLLLVKMSDKITVIAEINKQKD